MNKPKRIKSRRRVKEALAQIRNWHVDELYGEGRLVNPDCADFTETHPGVEGAKFQSNRSIRASKGKYNKER